jgi:starch synthase (maltosyl-transferring)
MDFKEGRERVVIEGVSPEIDGGLFPIKRTVREKVVVEADIFSDGHDLLSCVLLFRKEEDATWDTVAMEPLVNDRWQGSFRVNQMGRYRYTIEAWVDRFKTWRHDLKKRVDAGQDVSVDLRIGEQLIEEALLTCKGAPAKALKQRAAQITGTIDPEEKIELILDDDLAELMGVCSERRFVTGYEKELTVVAEREKARFSTWYEMFPRSCAGKRGEHGTFHDCEKMLPTSLPWASTFYICRPFIPSVCHTGKERTILQRLRGASRAAHGPSGRKQAGTRQFIRSWEASTTFAGSCRKPGSLKWRSLWIWRFSAARITPT